MFFPLTRGQKRLIVVVLAFTLAASLIGVLPPQAAAETAMPVASAVTTAAPADAATSFQLTVGITADNTTFTLPTSSFINGTNNGKDYDWSIDWGDGETQVTVGTSGYGDGIDHVYATTGSYAINISPNGSTEAWLAAFGFDIGSSRANSAANKQLITAVIGPLTPQMTRSTSQITGNAPVPNYEWAYLFYHCPNIVTGPAIEGWEQVTSTGDNFAQYMFEECTSLTGLQPGFNLPPNLTSVGGSFAYGMFNRCTSLESLPDGFTLPPSITTIGNGFAMSLFLSCTSLTGLPNSFNLPQGFTAVGDDFAYGIFSYCTSLVSLPAGFMLPPGIKTVGASFANSLFMNCSSLLHLPDNFNLPPGITATGINFAANMLSGCSSLVALPPGFNLPQGITAAADSFASNMLYGCVSLASLPDGFNLPQSITSASDYFAYGMFLYCTSLTSVPEGFNLPQGITSVGNRFASGIFSNCIALSYLPDGFNLPQSVTRVGDNFAAGFATRCESLKSLPDGFNLPPGITSAGYGFAYELFYLAGGPGFQVNDGFSFPLGVPTSTSSTYTRCLVLSESAPMQNRSAASIIGDCPTPSSKRDSFDERFWDIDYIAENWGGSGLVPPPVGPPGSGDLNGDGFVTMDEVLTCARVAIGQISLNPPQLAAIDMDRDGVITMADVLSVYRAAIN